VAQGLEAAMNRFNGGEEKGEDKGKEPEAGK